MPHHFNVKNAMIFVKDVINFHMIINLIIQIIYTYMINYILIKLIVKF